MKIILSLVKKLSTSCDCPCSNLMSGRRMHFDIQDILTNTEVHNCGKKDVFNIPRAFYDHCSSLGESCLAHSGMATYLEMT